MAGSYVPNRVIQLFEHESLQVGDELSGVRITERDLALLARLHGATGGRYFELTYRGIKTKSYVGVLKVGSLVVEILPKAHKQARKGLHEKERGPWRRLFIEVLSRSGYVPADLGARAEVFLERGSLLDLYVFHFVKAVRSVAREGLLRAYVPRGGVRPVLRGQIQFSRQVLRDMRGELGFDTRAIEYERGHILNRILKAALDVISGTHLSHLVRDELREVKEYFSAVPPARVTAELLGSLTFDRKSERYRNAIELARPILLSAHPGARSGSDETVSLLFDMTRVWERFVFLEVRKAAAKRGVVVDRQVARRFWEGRTVRPDIVVHAGDKRFVIDTKWKELSSPHPSEEDLRQMFTYNHIIDSTHSFLVYPDIHGVAGRDGLFENQMAGAKNHGCATYFVKVWRDVKGAVVFNAALGEEILERVVAA